MYGEKQKYIGYQKEILVRKPYGVIVCGGGPAGTAAAIASARNGANVCLVEAGGCLGGNWTSGLVSSLFDYENKGGILAEIIDILKERNAFTDKSRFHSEEMKIVLEELCLQENVTVLLNTRVVDTQVIDGRISMVVVSSAEGLQALPAAMFVDATGNGDVGMLAGCGFDVGDDHGRTQPLSLIALLTGVDANEVAEFISGGEGGTQRKQNLLQLLESLGLSPSYQSPTLMHIRNEVYAFMANHQYNVPPGNQTLMSEAIVQARREIYEMVNTLRQSGGIWKNIDLVTTGADIGIREGRRIHGLYKVTVDDLINGKRHNDPACTVTFDVDVHSVDPKSFKGYDNQGVNVKPYDIPMEALVARDVEGLLMAGRCISGDFISHASYRISGCCVAMGESAGKYAAKLIRERD